jgi:hypothetical protein
MGKAPLILNLSSKWRGNVTLTLWPLYPGTEPQYQAKRRLGGPQGRSGYFGEKKNLLPFARFESQTFQFVV